MDISKFTPSLDYLEAQPVSVVGRSLARIDREMGRRRFDARHSLRLLGPSPNLALPHGEKSNRTVQKQQLVIAPFFLL